MIYNAKAIIQIWKEDETTGTRTKIDQKTVWCHWNEIIQKIATRFHREQQGNSTATTDTFNQGSVEMQLVNINILQIALNDPKSITVINKRNTNKSYKIVDIQTDACFIGSAHYILSEGAYQ